MNRPRSLFGISVARLALSIFFDGLNTLVLPVYLLRAAIVDLLGIAQGGSL
jgi:hypothetical protein